MDREDLIISLIIYKEGEQKMKTNIFKIVEEKQRGRSHSDGEYRQYEYICNMSKDTLFVSDNIKSALDMWKRLTAENYRPNMALIVDYGLQSKEQYLRNKRNGCNMAASSEYDDVLPYVLLVEYHNGQITENTLELHVHNGIYDHVYHEPGMQNIVDALTFFSKVWDSTSYTMEEHSCIADEYTGKVFKRIRTIASSELLKKQKEYRGCEKIRRHIAIEINPRRNDTIERVKDANSYRDNFRMETVGTPCKATDTLTLL